ncbi:hypothetical protein IZU99_06235 [Oscillospiraceae bacterium CM]|nr:hypothetical protein IZU99_06235 [Oscillospiraceae bacterium CM]
MRGSARTVTVTAVMSALTLVFLYLANILPTGQLGMIAAASLFGVAAVIEGGMKAGIFVYLVSTGLAALFVPDKSAVLLYALFFGYYPVLKSLAERLKPVWLAWAVKLLVFNAVLTVVLFLFKALVYDRFLPSVPVYLAYLAGSAVFVVFDIGLRRLIEFYIVRISRNIRKNNSDR